VKTPSGVKYHLNIRTQEGYRESENCNNDYSLNRMHTNGTSKQSVEGVSFRDSLEVDLLKQKVEGWWLFIELIWKIVLNNKRV
jgi:hypothetical protein